MVLNKRTDGRASFLPVSLRTAVAQALIRALGAGVILAGLALALAFLTYDSQDPSWNTAAASGTAVHNLLGSFGSHVADILLQTLGLASFFIVLFLWGWGWRLITAGGIHRFAFRIMGSLVGLAVAPLALAAIPMPKTWLTGLGHGGGFLGELGLTWLTYDMGLSTWLCGMIFGVLSAGCLVWAAGYTWAEWGTGLSRLWQSGHWVGRWVLKILFLLKIPMGMAWRKLQMSLGRTSESKEHWSSDDYSPLLTGAEVGGEGASPFMASSLDDIPDVPLNEENGRTSTPGKSPRARRRSMSGKDQAALNLKSGTPEFELPPAALLQAPVVTRTEVSQDVLRQNARTLESVLADFGVKGAIVKVHPGPVVTLYELEPAPGTKSSRVISLADDIARSMSAVSVRVAVVPGRNVIGIELPNAKRETVYLRELLAAEAYEKGGTRLPLVLGKDIGGAPVVADLARMPHLLVAGTTGSGKSVAINTMILSLLYKLPPEKCRFIMVDPKMLELSIYEGIPHLLTPVVTEPKKAVVALKWTVREMEDRYRAMSKVGVRNIEGYNARLREAREKGEILTRRVQTGFDPDTGKPIMEDQPIDLTELPYIVVIVDEMADLMLVAGKDIEAAVQRLAQMARAAGIHLITATQRPSVDVITGTIKANFPTRISFQVTSKIDSRTILGEQGAEQLLGQGDMLYMAGGGRITRVHGPFVSDGEVESVVKFLRAQGEPNYVDAVTEDTDEDGMGGGEGGMGDAVPGGGSGDQLYDQAVALVCRERKASTSFIQRHLRIGYNSAARLMERMEKEGVVSSANHAGKREVLARNIEEAV